MEENQNSLNRKLKYQLLFKSDKAADYAKKALG